MVRRLLLFALAAPLVCFTAHTAGAQEPDTEAAAPAHVAFVEGAVTLERDGRPETAPLNMPLLSGDRIRTTTGRVEILFGDESTLFIDARTTIDFQSDDLLRLIDGRIRVSIPRGAEDVAYRIDSPAGSARLTQAGEYRIALVQGERETQLELAVLRGAGDVFTDQGTTPVRAGERAYASVGLAPSYAYAYNSATWDDFDRWAEARRDVRLGASAQYLPSEMRSYAPVLDEYGDWRYDQSYGQVWYPRVSAGWRPYYYGRWVSYPRYGWTWVGMDRFGWPTHHYGRWGFSAGSWFWIPGRHFSPAWVSWAYAPGYVSWCPLGFDNRPIFGINVSIGSRYYSPWTVVAAPHFGYGYVHQRVIFVDRVFDHRSRPVFVGRSSAPAFRDVAIPRNSVPIRWAGSRHLESSRPGGGGRDSYFTRESVQRDHAVERGGGAPVQAPARTNDGAAARRFGGTRAPSQGAPVRPDVGPGVAAPRAVPRGSASESGVRPFDRTRDSTGRPGFQTAPGSGVMRRTAPEGAVRQVAPTPSMSPQRAPSRVEGRAPSRVEGGESAVPRERVGRDTRQPAYGAPSSPVRRADPPVYSAPAARAPMYRDRGYAPSRVEGRPSMSPRGAGSPGDGRAYARPEMAAPRPSMPSQPTPRAYEPRPSMSPQGAPSRIEGRPSMSPRAEPRREAPAPRSYSPPPRPSQSERPSMSPQGAPSRAAPRDGGSRPSSPSAPSGHRSRGR